MIQAESLTGIPVIVAIAGMPRSASTFSFNIARELLGDTGRVVAISDNTLNPKLAGEADHLIIKTHNPDQPLMEMIAGKTIPCICTYRKPEDAIASWVRTFGGTVGSASAIIESWLKWHVRIHEKVLNLSYEHIETNQLDTITRIQLYLTGREDIAQAEKLNEAYQKSALKEQTDALQKNDDTTDIGFSYYDNKTFFHRRHISSIRSIAAEDEFSPSQISTIRNYLIEYIDSSGNYNLQEIKS
ncbi:MAG: hypothetical protein ACYC43_09430 [Burkholderiales bacterium]